jgi:antibiotic biosynthesis monooxygenase (ABM) superfamily enzyme
MSFFSRARMALLMTIAVYPLVVGYAALVALFTPDWAFWQRGLIIVPFVATTIVFFVVPTITRRFGGFIAGKPKTAA